MRETKCGKTHRGYALITVIGIMALALNMSVIIADAAPSVHPIANFSTNVTEGYAPLSVQFNDSSENATEWNWDFGDGTNSTEQNPIHTYFEMGNYTVILL
ncbi:PKD domain-containing protein [Methanosarcina sp.]|uniref:PKD domain-containing protein n=1 Tax=Methanosarcina sp. TaxID=2213 RepID=UPI003C719F6C